MNLFIFQNPYEFFQFFYVFENTILGKNNLGTNRETVNSYECSFHDVLKCDMESC